MAVDWQKMLDAAEGHDAQVDQEYTSLFGGGYGSDIPPRVLEIVKALKDEPLLVQPVLEFVNLKKAEMADAKLVALYGRERVEQMKAALREQEALA